MNSTHTLQSILENTPQNTPVYMAILNVTPDSFSDGGVLMQTDALLKHAESLLLAGAHILDIGGESTRPGAEAVSSDTEKRRVLPVIKTLQDYFPEVYLSIDTRKASVAKASLEAGVAMVNDVSGFQYDALMPEVVAGCGSDLVLMHSQGTPNTMQNNPTYGENGIVNDVITFFTQQLRLAGNAGVQANCIALDVGFGFGKTVAQNQLLLENLKTIQEYTYSYNGQSQSFPILAGLSRKSFLAKQAGVFESSYPHDHQTLDTLSEQAQRVAFEQDVQLFRVHRIPGKTD